MTRRIEIKDPNIQSKIRNFIITCNRLNDHGQQLSKAQQASIALKLIIRFLKKNAEYLPLYEMLSEQEYIEDCYNVMLELQNNDFCFEFSEKELLSDNLAFEEERSTECRYSLGDIVQLGSKTVRNVESPLSWIVVKISGPNATLLSLKAVFWDVYDVDGHNKWETSSLRRKLNVEWFNETFSEQEKHIIKSFLTINKDRIKENDKVRILFSDEVESLALDSTLKADRLATWWTASVADDNGSSLQYYQRNGHLAEVGYDVTKRNGVRPSIMIYAPINAQNELASSNNQIQQKTIAIVENDDGSFFIAPLNKTELLTRSNLLRYVDESSIYHSFDQAEQSALRLQNLLKTPDETYLIKNVSLPEILEQEFIEKNQKRVYKDKNGISIFSIDSDGKIIVESIKEDVDYKYIKKNEYEAELFKLIRELDEHVENDFSYYSLGLRQGYCVALKASLPYIRFEIFKANELIREIDDDQATQDLFCEDRKLYLGYIEALYNATEIQKKYKLVEGKWIVNLINLRDEILCPEVTEYDNFSEEYGDYHVCFYSCIPPQVFDSDKRYIYLVYIDKTKDWVYRDTTLELNLPDNVVLDFISDKQKLTFEKIDKLVKNTLKKHTTLGTGDSDYTIDNECVTLLSDFKNIISTEQSDENGGKSNDVQLGEIKEDETGNSLVIKKRSKLAPYEFCQNKDLKDIKLPMSAAVIPEGMFYGCTSLEDVLMPTELLEIQASAFEGCCSMWRVFLPNTVNKIGDRAFMGCSELRKVFLPNKLEYLGSKAFAKCTRLKSIHLPPTIEFVAGDAFEGCDSLTLIEMPYGCSVALNDMDGIKISYYRLRYNMNDKKKENAFPDVVQNDDLLFDDITEKTSINELLSFDNLKKTEISDSALKLLEWDNAQ